MHKSALHIIWFFLAVIWSNTAQGQEYPMLHYTVENGLPSNTVYCVYQDKDGIIWVGTDKGVARFNGTEFRTFTTADGLADNECFCFREDLYGRLWIGTFNGELCYYQNGRFHNARNTPFLKHNFSASNTFDIAVHRDSSITVFYKDNPGFIEIRKDKVRTLVPKVMLDRESAQLISIEKLPGGRYALLYVHERLIVDSSLSLLSVQPHNGFYVLGHYLGNSKRAGYHLADKGRMYTEDLQPFSFRAQDLVGDARLIRFIKEDGFEWLSTNKGVYFDRTLLLKGKIVNDAYKDSQGNCWISTNKNGIYLLSAGFYKTGYWPGAYKEEIVFAECRDSILCYAEKDKSLYRIHTGAKGAQAQQLAKPGDYSGSSLDNIFCGWVHRNSFYAFNYTGIYRMDSIRSPKTGKIKVLKNDPKTISYLKQVDEGP
ncbi:MAG TPA: two-component regulator propeller domain-containing protein, partial [Chitinophagaceae bacterium]|nr:two-component regulator propeller domain-containing protein [Chitinophagaceae bacterium]